MRPPPSRGQAPRPSRGTFAGDFGGLAPQVLSQITWWRSLPRRSSHESLGGELAPQVLSHESLGGGACPAGPLTNHLVAELAPQVLSRITWWRACPAGPLSNHLVAGLPRRSSHESLGGGACPAGPITNHLVAGPRRSSHESLGGGGQAINQHIITTRHT